MNFFYGLGRLSLPLQVGRHRGVDRVAGFRCLVRAGGEREAHWREHDRTRAESEEVQDLLREEFATSESNLVVVFSGDGAGATSEGFRAAERAALEEVQEMPQVSGVQSYADAQSERFVSEDGDESYAADILQIKTLSGSV